MAILRWNDPFTNIMPTPFDDFLHGFWGSNPATAGQSAPAMDVYTEDEKSLVAEISAPGFSQGDIEVQVHDGILEIKGEKHEKEEDKGSKKRNYMMRESHASFYRSIQLPKVADADAVRAHFENGVLKVTVPFKELPAPKKIAITAAKNKK